ncbi:DUF4167 domain-containing protein [Bosea vaviloviae]|uniref:DUF4167 domain-containing protein n=1 Tax=Bosea vaviloviae TaxID=1526658 RepID=UPI0009F6D0D8
MPRRDNPIRTGSLSPAVSLARSCAGSWRKSWDEDLMRMHRTRQSSLAALPLRPAARTERAQSAALQTANRQSASLQSARRTYERYLALARREALIGDRIKAEGYYQHAEHHLRVQAGMARPQPDI